MQPLFQANIHLQGIPEHLRPLCVHCRITVHQKLLWLSDLFLFLLDILSHKHTLMLPTCLQM